MLFLLKLTKYTQTKQKINIVYKCNNMSTKTEIYHIRQSIY
jgi:hypothetical protein